VDASPSKPVLTLGYSASFLHTETPNKQFTAVGRANLISHSQALIKHGVQRASTQDPGRGVNLPWKASLSPLAAAAAAQGAG